MDTSQLKRKTLRRRRKLRVRKHLRGSQQKPRLCVLKTNNHIHVQVIDDDQSATVASTSTLSKEFRKTAFNQKNVASAKQLGLKIAELMKAKEIKRVVFDRGPFKYHGVIAAVADGAREGGVEF